MIKTLRPTIRLLLLLSLSLLTSACISLREPDPPIPQQECLCGTITAPTGTKTCALWYKHWDKKRPQPVLTTANKGKCTVDACKKFPNASLCNAFEAHVETPLTKMPADMPCFCDWVPMPNDRRGASACAIWKPGDLFLIEYHFTERCDFLTCKAAPFQYSKTFCTKGFRSFYE